MRCAHASIRPAWCTRFVQPEILSKSLEVLVSYLAHVLSLLALRPGVVGCVCLISEHDGPDGIATEAYGCAPEDDDGYGCAGCQSHDRRATT